MNGLWTGGIGYGDGGWNFDIGVTSGVDQNSLASQQLQMQALLATQQSKQSNTTMIIIAVIAIAALVVFKS